MNTKKGGDLELSKVYEVRNGIKIRRIKRTAVYIRISTSKKGQPRSVDSQIAPLLEYIDKTPFTTLAETQLIHSRSAGIWQKKESLKVEEHHVGIVSKELFDQMQKAIETRRHKK